MGNILMKKASNKTISFISLIGMLLFLPLLLVGVWQMVTIVSRASGKPANIVVDASTVYVINEGFTSNMYHAFAQGGEEPADMLAPVFDEVKALKPKFIRIDHIYDYFNVVGKSENDLTFDFTKLDKSVDTITKLGATPVLALTFMPAVIAKGGSIINPPEQWKHWEEVVQKTIEYYSGKTGKNLTGVYYEVWNEPDLDQFGKWNYKGDKNYISLYTHASDGAKNAKNVNQFFLGGSATTGLYKNWTLALLDAKRKGARVDFLSWHSYLPDPDTYAMDQKNLISWIDKKSEYTEEEKNKFKQLPTLITEFGFTGNKDIRYGTMYGAAYTAAAIRQMLGDFITTSRPLAVFTFQPKDGPNQTEGNGWGLLTHESAGKKPKPRYYLFPYLDTMEGKFVDLRGEGSWVTGFATKKDGVLRILLVNFDQGEKHVEAVPITVTKLAPGMYTYKERWFQGQPTTRDVVLKETISGQPNEPLIKKIYMPASSVVILELVKE